MSRTYRELIEDRFGLPPETDQDEPAEGPLADILARRTHRRYLPDPIDPALTERLLACALSASSKSDLQQASIIVVRDPEKQARIASWLPGMPWIAAAPLFMVFCGDNRRLRKAFAVRERPFPNDNVDMFMNAAVDAALVMQTFVLAAEAAGLGCCCISEIRTHIDALTELLELPEHVFPISGLCVGYPAQTGFVSMRLPPALTVHHDAYDDTDIEGELEAYDLRRDARFSLPADRQRDVERFGVADFYGWSEDKARQYASPARPGFRAYLNRRGFALE